MALFKDDAIEQMMKIYTIVYLLTERSLRVRNKDNITLREALILESIYRLVDEKRNIPSQLAKYLNVSLPSLSTTIKSLMRKKYIRKRLSTEDNRFYFLDLTQKGIDFNIKNRLFRESLSMKAFGPLTWLTNSYIRALADKVGEFAQDEHLKLDEIEKLEKNTR